LSYKSYQIGNKKAPKLIRAKFAVCINKVGVPQKYNAKIHKINVIKKLIRIITPKYTTYNIYKRVASKKNFTCKVGTYQKTFQNYLLINKSTLYANTLKPPLPYFGVYGSKVFQIVNPGGCYFRPELLPFSVYSFALDGLGYWFNAFYLI